MLCQPRSGDFSRWTDRLFFFFFFFFWINLAHGYDERDLYVKQNRQHTMVPTKTQATKPVHFHSAKTAQSSDQPNTRCRGGKAQSNKHCQGKL
ncbi:hypothetical protein ABBQ32_011004 [Trebouxia sp. C0010 RCD-2024]